VLCLYLVLWWDSLNGQLILFGDLNRKKNCHLSSLACVERRHDPFYVENHILGCENEQRIVDSDHEEKSEGLGVGFLLMMHKNALVNLWSPAKRNIGRLQDNEKSFVITSFTI
jgi:hypothetical protein